MRKSMKANLKSRLGILGAVLLAGSWFAASAPAGGQDVRITKVEVDDRQVTLEWTKHPGDTMSAEDRQRIASATFVVPNSLGIDPGQFERGQIVAGRGGLRATPGGDWEISVGNPGEVFLAGEEPVAPEGPTFTLTGAFPFGRDYVGIGFAQRVNVEQATDLDNYVFSPSLALDSVALQENGMTVIIRTTGDLPQGATYTVSVSNVTSLDGGLPLVENTAGFQTTFRTIVNLSELQEFGQSGDDVAVIGEVFHPVGAPAGVPSGFIQDGSGRGINLLSGEGDEPQEPVNATGNVVMVLGQLEGAGVRLRIVEYTSFLLAAGQPPLAPRVIPVRDVNEVRWRGDYIQTEADLVRTSEEADADQVRYYTSRSDTVFAGYTVWRGESPDPEKFLLMRTYSLLDTTWTFGMDDLRTFADPESVIARGTEADRSRDPDAVLAGPHNGFPYYYSVTWFDAYIDPSSTPPVSTTFDRTTIPEGMYPEAIYPSKPAREATPLLGNVKVVPNPYNPSASYQQQAFPGAPRVQFINLPAKATVDIYTAAGDRVRSLDHEGEDDSMDWDLKNNDGKDVSPGVYVYYVRASSESATGRFVIIR